MTAFETIRKALIAAGEYAKIGGRLREQIMAALVEVPQVERQMAEDAALIAEAAKVTESFAAVWNRRPPFDVTKLWEVKCQIGEDGSWRDIAALHAKLAAHGKPVVPEFLADMSPEERREFVERFNGLSAEEAISMAARGKAKLAEPAQRGHHYPEPASYCAYGCGCFKGTLRYAGPEDINPLGECPCAPKEASVGPAECPTCGRHNTDPPCSCWYGLQREIALRNQPKPAEPLHGNPFFDIWRCSSCGESQADSSDPRWRWTGEAWEHKCGDPQAGYFPARNFGKYVEPFSQDRGNGREGVPQPVECCAARKHEWMEWSHGGKGVPWRINTEEFNALLDAGWKIVTVEHSFTLLHRAALAAPCECDRLREELRQSRHSLGGQLLRLRTREGELVKALTNHAQRADHKKWQNDQLRAELAAMRAEHETVISNLAIALFPTSPTECAHAEFLLDGMGACQVIDRLRTDLNSAITERDKALLHLHCPTIANLPKVRHSDESWERKLAAMTADRDQWQRLKDGLEEEKARLMVAASEAIGQAHAELRAELAAALDREKRTMKILRECTKDFSGGYYTQQWRGPLHAKISAIVSEFDAREGKR